VANVLVTIKRAVLAGRYAFSEKARAEMEASGLTELDVVESIANAVAIYKRIRSTSPYRKSRAEYLYVIQSPTFRGRSSTPKASLCAKKAIQPTTSWFHPSGPSSELKGTRHAENHGLSHVRE
jgi:hypothetical protein